MTDREFEITVYQSRVYAVWGLPDDLVRPDAEVDRFSPDTLTLATAQLLEHWLNLWGRIERAKIRSSEAVLNDSPIRVIGAQLWRLLLDNKIGTALKQEIKTRRKLRVLITFDDSAHPALKSLPWEFLCAEVDGEPRFLAAETDLLLTRFVNLAAGRTAVVPAEENLGVLFVNLLPRDVPQSIGDGFEELRNKVADIPGIHAPQVVENLELEEFLKNREEPCHVVHVVGQCSGTTDDPKMYLPTKDNPGWQKPKPLIDALTPDGADPPRLVILHLCENELGDASDNFERVAPALIRARIPAVLAMQYPMPATADPEGVVGVEFYRSLANGEWVGAAVQSSRRRMSRQGQYDRRFGTPVLYLQQDGALRSLKEKAQGTVVDSRGPTLRINSDTIRQAFFKDLDESPIYDRRAAAAVREELERVTIPDSVEAARLMLGRLHRDSSEPEQKLIYGSLNDAVVRLGRGPENAKVRKQEEDRPAASPQFFKAQRN